MTSDTPPPVLSSLRVYTPFQVRVAAFFGGPFAAIYTLHWNFRVLGKSHAQRLTLYWGAAFTVTLIATLPFVPESLPRFVIPLAYAMIAEQIAKSKQLTKEAILSSSIYQRHSGWNVTLVSLLSILAILAVVIPSMLALDYFGVLKLD